MAASKLAEAFRELCSVVRPRADMIATIEAEAPGGRGYDAPCRLVADKIRQRGGKP